MGKARPRLGTAATPRHRAPDRRAASQPECVTARTVPWTRTAVAELERGSRRWGVVLDVPARPQRSLPVGCDYQHHTLMCNRNQRSADRFYPMTGGKTPPLPAARCADWLCRSWVVRRCEGVC